MIHKIKKLIAVLLTLSALCGGAGCTIHRPNKQPTITPQGSNDAPVFMLDQLPEIGGYVDDILCNRRYPDTRETLTPGENYGKLIPFTGSFREYHFVNYETGQWLDSTMSVAKYGLMTDKGEIIVDAVYDGISIDQCDNGQCVFTLYQSDGEFEEISRQLICNWDGTWVKESDGNAYYNFNAWDDGLVIATDYSQLDYIAQKGTPTVTFFDTKGNRLFGFNNCTASGTDGFSDGYMVISFYTDYFSYEYSNRFVDVNGNLAFPGIHPLSSFENGKAPATDSNGLCGLFSSQGNWIIPPVYTELYKSDNYYVASNGFDCIVYDLSGNKILAIDGTVMVDQYLRTAGEHIYLEASYFDEASGHYRSYFTEAYTNEIIRCKETGQDLSNHFYDTEYLYCDDGEYTYIVDLEGNTVAKLEGTGILEKIDDTYFSFTEGSWMDDTQIYNVYTFQGFQKLWSQEITNTFGSMNLWADTGFMIRSYYPEAEGMGLVLKGTSDILELKTGEPIWEGLTGYRLFDIEGMPYLSCSDGTYTYCYDPQMKLLMKTRNTTND